LSHPQNKGKGDKWKKDNKETSNGQAPSNGTADADAGDDTASIVHPFVLPETPEPIEPRLPFLFASAYLQYAILLVEERILKLEGIRKRISVEGTAELRLCHIQNGNYGEVEIGN
jgi:hypothetical protein